MKRKNNLLIVKTVIIGIVYFVIAFLLEAARWFQTTWDDMDFATAVYQLSTPLKGTDQGIILSFCEFVFPAVITREFFVVAVFYLFNRIFGVINLKFKIKCLGRTFLIKLGRKFYLVGKVLFVVLLSAVSVYEIYGKVTELGIDDYIVDLMETSTIYEERYIAPEKVNITFPESKRNLIFIYLESMETTYASVDAGGGKPDNYIPELVDLANEYVNISNTDTLGGAVPCAGTGWTVAALLSTTSGVTYKLPGDGNSADRYAEFLPGLCTLGDILQNQGYKNYFMCGSEAEFAGRDVYFKKHGNYEIMDYNYAKDSGFIPEDYYVYWGIEDWKLYELAKQELNKIGHSEENFNFTMLTVDTHTPEGYICELCENKYENQYANAIACSSKQTYEFVKWIQQQEWYENTTVILLGDHNSMKADFWDDINGYKRTTYNCFINLPESVDTTNIKNRKFNNLDIFPTVLASLGAQIEGNRIGLGVNLFSDEQTLLEELGGKVLGTELQRYSKYYTEKFVQGK